jgi:general secretion pathway protein I
MECWGDGVLQYSRPPRLKPRDVRRASTPWPGPGLQGQISTDSTSEILQRQQRIPGKSRQGRPVLPGPHLACRARSLQTQLLKYCRDNNVFQASRARAGQYSKETSGFTLLEVMIAVAVIAIALVAVFGSQSQSLSLANEAKFNTTAALLAQSKIAEMAAEKPEDLTSDSGDFGEDFPDYHWNLTVSDVSFGEEEASEYLKQIDLSLSYGEHGRYQYRLRLYRFVP